MRPWLIFVLLGILLVVGGIAGAGQSVRRLAGGDHAGRVLLPGRRRRPALAGVSRCRRPATAVARADRPARHGRRHLLLANPLQGLISLTLILGVVFLVTGIARLVLSFRLRDTPMFWLLLLSGAASVLIGVMVFGNFAAAATSLLGLLLGIQLIADGVALLALGIAGGGCADGCRIPTLRACARPSARPSARPYARPPAASGCGWRP